jgi:hypothetical protein
MAADVRARLAELDGLLTDGIRDRPVVTFGSLRRTDTYPPFDPGQLGEPLPAPAWEDFAPAPPSGIGKILGGTGRFERQLDSARTAGAQAAEQHTAAEADRCRQRAAQRAAYDATAAAFAAAAEHNAGIKHATKGILITTSWVTKDGHAFADRHGRIEIMECEHVKYLCKEHLGLDVLISLPKSPPH